MLKLQSALLGVGLMFFASLFGPMSVAHAEEGGSGHYFPGSMASFADGVPAEPTFIARLNVLHYDGGIDASRAVPIAGLTAFNVAAQSTGVGLTLLWAPDWSLGGNWSYAMSTTIPWLSMDISADVQTGGQTVGLEDKETGLGDIILMPVMLNYAHSANLNSNYRIAFYAPTGSYEVGRLANTGKNFWTIEPTAAVVYLGKENGIEASLFAGVDFNFENSDTSYKSGTQGHLEGTLAQHFPFSNGVASGGLTGGLYRQITGDSGEGAYFGEFKARAHNIGPVISYATKVHGSDVIAELKWLHEFDNRDRLEGDTLFFKLLAKF